MASTHGIPKPSAAKLKKLRADAERRRVDEHMAKGQARVTAARKADAKRKKAAGKAVANTPAAKRSAAAKGRRDRIAEKVAPSGRQRLLSALGHGKKKKK